MKETLGRYYDEGLAARMGKAWLERAEEQARLRQDVERCYQGEFDDVRRRYEAVYVECAHQFSALHEEIADLWEKMRQGLEATCPLVLEVPEAEGGDELGEGLYDARRRYLEQLEAYRAFRGN